MLRFYINFLSLLKKGHEKQTTNLLSIWLIWEEMFSECNQYVKIVWDKCNNLDDVPIKK